MILEKRDSSQGIQKLLQVMWRSRILEKKMEFVCKGVSICFIQLCANSLCAFEKQSKPQIASHIGVQPEAVMKNKSRI